MKNKMHELIVILNKAFMTRRKAVLQKSQAYGLYVGQPQILNYVQQHPGCTQTEIAENVGVSSASIAFSTKRLQKSGFLQKQVNNLNMRCNRLYVTPEGLEVMKKYEKVYDELNLSMFDGFTREELELLESFAERVNENLEKRMKG